MVCSEAKEVLDVLGEAAIGTFVEFANVVHRKKMMHHDYWLKLYLGMLQKMPKYSKNVQYIPPEIQKELMHSIVNRVQQIILHEVQAHPNSNSWFRPWPSMLIKLFHLVLLCVLLSCNY